MASGMGLNGNVGRCFHRFQDFASCMKTSDQPVKECVDLRDDYLECLHNKKERTRQRAIEEAKLNSEEAEHSSTKNGKSEGTGHH